MRSVEMLVIVMGTEVIDGVAKLLGFVRAAEVQILSLPPNK